MNQIHQLIKTQKSLIIPNVTKTWKNFHKQG